MLAVAAPEEAGQTREAVSLPHGDPEPLRYLRLGRCSCRPSVPGIQFDRTFSRPSKSYILDRRNTYGESPHGARKSIPGGKAGTHRAEQHQVRQALAPGGARRSGRRGRDRSGRNGDRAGEAPAPERLQEGARCASRRSRRAQAGEKGCRSQSERSLRKRGKATVSGCAPRPSPSSAP